MQVAGGAVAFAWTWTSDSTVMCMKREPENEQERDLQRLGELLPDMAPDERAQAASMFRALASDDGKKMKLDKAGEHDASSSARLHSSSASSSTSVRPSQFEPKVMSASVAKALQSNLGVMRTAGDADRVAATQELQQAAMRRWVTQTLVSHVRGDVAGLRKQLANTTTLQSSVSHDTLRSTGAGYVINSLQVWAPLQNEDQTAADRRQKVVKLWKGLARSTKGEAEVVGSGIHSEVKQPDFPVDVRNMEEFIKNMPGEVSEVGRTEVAVHLVLLGFHHWKQLEGVRPCLLYTSPSPRDS